MFLKNLFKYWTYQIFSPGTVLREKYEAFKSFLTHDKYAHELMAELEEIYYNPKRVDFQVVTKKYDQMALCVSRMIEELSRICPSRYLTLRDYFKKFDFYIRFMLAPPKYDFSPPFTLKLDEIPTDNPLLVGSKALQLSVIKKNLRLPVPEGFVITTNSFYYFVEYNDLRKEIDEKLSDLDIYSPVSLNNVSKELVALIMGARIPPDIKDAILSAFRKCQWDDVVNVRIAMRSSAVGEDGRFSFAGQYQTILNVKEDDIFDAYKKVIASKYSPTALYYRINAGFIDIETPMAVLALEMIDSATSGIIYTQELENPTSKCLHIHSIWGLGELLVSGGVSPDAIKVTKERNPKIIAQKIGVKHKQMTLSQNNATKIVSVPKKKKEILSIDHASILTLARWGSEMEKFYKEAQDIEWSQNHAGRLFILQSRPLKLEGVDTTVEAFKFDDIEHAVLISGGETASSGIGAGRAVKVTRQYDLKNLPQGSVLVVRNTSPQYVTIMDRLNAVVTDTGSIAGHFSSVAREFGVPTLVNTIVATAKVPQGREVTVHAARKVVYDGIVKSMVESPCARRDLLADSPFMRKLKYIISFISPLKLVDPDSKSFAPEGCRSLHDVIRFSHEKAVQEMFSIGGGRRVTRRKGAKKLISKIPMSFYVLDVGGGLEKKPLSKKEVSFEDIKCIPMQAVFKGLSHPQIHWSGFTHFDWEEYDKIVMHGGIISADASQFGSYAILSDDYLNLNLRFGYHFVILDTICGNEADKNYILFRFSGGGGSSYGKSLRAKFLCDILERLGFNVVIKGDLVDGQLKQGEKASVANTLDMVGRLLGATRLMDIYLKDASQVEGFVEDFMNGRYHFAPIER